MKTSYSELIFLTAEMEIFREAAYRHHLDALDFCAELGASQMVLHHPDCEYILEYAPMLPLDTLEEGKKLLENALN